MMKIQRKVLVEGTVKDVKSGVNAKGKAWYLVKLEQGKGTENVFVEGIDKSCGVSKLSDLIGKDVAISGELWKDKSKGYNLVYMKMKVTTVLQGVQGVQGADEIPFA